MKDYALIANAYNKTVRIYVASSTTLVDKARSLHGTWPTATAAFGRLLTIGAMMGLMHKEGERITIKIKGDGPLGLLLVEAHPNGEVRGEISNPHIYLKTQNDSYKNKLDVGAAIGNGFLFVTRDSNLKNLFTSSTKLQSGEIGDDFTYYFTVSEQIPSSVGVGVLIGTDQSVLASGGYILQLMPGVSEETIVELEKIISDIPPLSSLINDKKTPEQILSLLANKTESILKKQSISYVCNCSKYGFSKSLSALDNETMDLLINEDKKAEIECHFCHKKHLFTQTELLEIKSKRKKK